jgi:hypothetical protein
MSSDPNDIVSGARLAMKLYDLGFKQEDAADSRYKNFRNDIFNFRNLLGSLQRALQDAQRRFEGSSHPIRIHAYSPLSKEFEDERKTIIGNFVGTLNTCDKLLEEIKKYRLKYSNVIENLRWHLSQQERRVDDLRTRLQFHSEKIRLVMDRLSINLLTDIDAKVDDLLAVSEQNLQVSNETLYELIKFRSALFGNLSGRYTSLSAEVENAHRVSDMISLKFQEHLLLDAPPTISYGMPLVQGFDALFLSFQQSISSSDCTPESYLSFLKTRWLLECLSISEEYRAARPGLYYKRAINQISQALTIRMRQPGILIAYEESMLIGLPDTHFRIWPPSDSVSVIQQSDPHPLMIRANEEEVMRVTLDHNNLRGSDTVTIFKSSEEHFRIILETTLASRPDEKILIPQPIYTREDKLIPRYALSIVDEPDFEIAISSRNEETLYKFGTAEILFRFQAALTGYNVSHDQQAIRCQFSDDVSYLDCKGRVQIWQEPIVLNTSNEARRSSNTLSSFPNGTQSRSDGLTATAVTSNTMRWTNGGREVESIKLPALVIFTELVDAKKGKQFAILFIELESGVHVDPKECSCCRAYDNCSKLVLVDKKKTGMTVRALISDIEHTSRSGFDLFPFRTPRHPDFRKLKTLRTDYLVLKFGTLQDKRRFDKELEYRLRLRDKQTQNQRDFTKRSQRLETQRQLSSGSFADMEIQAMECDPERTADKGRTIPERDTSAQLETSAVPSPKAQGTDRIADVETGSNMQAKVVSTRGSHSENLSFQDSGIGSDMQQEDDRSLSASHTDASSIRSAWSTLRLDNSLKVSLKDLFVNTLVTETESYIESDAALGEVSNLLRDYAILVRKDATRHVHHEAAKFIRAERLGLAENYKGEAKLRLRTRHELNSQAMVSEWLVASATTASSYDDLDTAWEMEQPNDLADVTETSEETSLGHRLLENDKEWEKTEEHREFLLESPLFTWLVERINIMNTRSCVGSSYYTIRSVIADSLDRSARSSAFTMTLREWDPLQFLQQQYPCESCELSRVLVYCGSLEAPYACTIGEYLEYMWPKVGGTMLSCVQSACGSQERRSVADVAGAVLLVETKEGTTKISLSGHGPGVLELAETCVWLATACRAHDGSDWPAICSPHLDVDSLEMTVSYIPVAEDQALVEGLCWLRMLRNPVIANGYPVPRRADGENQKGLEVSIDVLLTLSQANWATTFQDKFVLKGLRSALVPTSEDALSIRWHFLTTHDTSCRMTYTEAHEFASTSTVTIGEMSGPQHRRHFVGIWTSSAQLLTGSSSKGKRFYELYQSDSDPIEHLTLTPNAFSITGGKFVTAGGSFALGRKDSRLAQLRENDFEFRLHEVEGWKVLFYGEKDKRAWLIDGLSALLHLSITWLVERAPKESFSSFTFGPRRYGRPDAKNVLLDNRSLSIHEKPESYKVEITDSQQISQSSHGPVPDSAYGSGNGSSTGTIRKDLKSTVSSFTYEALVEHFFQVMEAMLENLSTTAQAIPQLEFRKPDASPVLIGWEAKDIILQRTHKGIFTASHRPRYDRADLT